MAPGQRRLDRRLADRQPVERRGDMTVRQGTDDADRLLVARNDRAALQERLEAGDPLGRPVGEIEERALPDLAALAVIQTLLADLATIARNTVTTAIAPDLPFTITTRPTPIQKKAFALLGVSCTQ